jgi:hypothetical protein
MEFLNFARKEWDRVAAVIAAAAGAVALFLGWFGASDNVNPAGQIPYVISGGLAGVFLIAVASTLWLSADLRDEWRKLDRLEQRMEREHRTPS